MKTEEQIRDTIRRMESQREWHKTEREEGRQPLNNTECIQCLDARIAALMEVLE